MIKRADRISEGDLLIPTLRLLAAAPGGYLSTSDLIGGLEKEFEPEGEDAKILNGRQDSKFSQIVRNMKSHKDSPANIIGRGFAEAFKDGLRITDAGRADLKANGG